jgi:hypothetical protein
MLPISAADIIEFRPAAERVAKATADLEATREVRPVNPVAVQAAEQALSDAEAAQAQRDPVYRLRVPTIRTKSAAARDLMAEGISPKGDDALIAALAADPSQLSPEDAAFLSGVQSAMTDGAGIPPADWPRVYGIARSVPEAARIIADRIHHSAMNRLHIIRHHLILEGQRSPLSESAIDALPADDLGAIGDKIESFLAPTRDEAKNSDAP